MTLCKCCKVDLGYCYPYDYCRWCWDYCKKSLREFYENDKTN